MRRLLIALPILAVLALAPTALAGGWATVGLDSTPGGVARRATVEREHHRAPARADAAGGRDADGDDPQRRLEKTFTATATKKPGVSARR